MDSTSLGKTTKKPKPRTWLGFLRDHLIAFLLCVGFPAMVTAIAPVSWVKFERRAESVAARADICLLFVIPYRTLVIDPVIGIDDQFVAGHLTNDHNHHRGSHAHSTRSEDEAFLVIHGQNETASVPVSPYNIRSVSTRAKEFLTDPQSPELRMTVVANWKFSVIAGGLVSLLTVLYVIGILSSIVTSIWRIFGFGKPATSPVN